MEKIDVEAPYLDDFPDLTGCGENYCLYWWAAFDLENFYISRKW